MQRRDCIVDIRTLVGIGLAAGLVATTAFVVGSCSDQPRPNCTIGRGFMAVTYRVVTLPRIPIAKS